MRFCRLIPQVIFLRLVHLFVKFVVSVLGGENGLDYRRIKKTQCHHNNTHSEAVIKGNEVLAPVAATTAGNS